MNHNEAVRLQAAEKYLLNEFTPSQREEYEEHYFDCYQCAEDVKATASFLEGVRQLIREGVLEPETAHAAAPAMTRAAAPASRGFLAWLKPALAIPVFAALLLFIGYQNSVTIPRLQNPSSSGGPQIVSTSIHLAGSVRGGDESGQETTKLHVHSGEGFILDFDFTPARTFDNYHWELRDESKHLVTRGTLSGDKTNQAVHLAVLGGVARAGKYSVIFFGGATGDAMGAPGKEVQRLTFIVEFVQ